MTIGIIGSGAFGTALGMALTLDGNQVALWGRDAAAQAEIEANRENPKLPGVTMPPEMVFSGELEPVFSADIILLAIPAQTLRPFLATHGDALSGKYLVACCKGIDLERMTGPGSTIRDMVPDAIAAMLTGPSFAADIARGLPTALTLACTDEEAGAILQTALSTTVLRLYRTKDVAGAELGGALKNVMAIASGVAIGAGLGESARAALMTRGFPEMQRLAAALGADPDTLSGLSGFGDLVLTCTSEQSRNFRYGLALGRGDAVDTRATVEGVVTAQAVRQLAQELQIDLPICTVVSDLTNGQIDAMAALNRLLSRPLKEE